MKSIICYVQHNPFVACLWVYSIYLISDSKLISYIALATVHHSQQELQEAMNLKDDDDEIELTDSSSHQQEKQSMSS